MSIAIEALIQRIGTEPPAPVYLIAPGKTGGSKTPSFEPVLAQEAVDRFIATYITPDIRDFAYSQHYGDDTPAAQVAETARTFPFLAERRLVVVYHADSYESDAAGRALHEYIAEPAEFTILVLIAPRIDQRMKLFKTCKSHGVIVECPQLGRAQLEARVRTQAEIYGKTFRSDAVRALLDRTPPSLGDLDSAVRLVCDYVGNKSPKITLEDVEAASTDAVEEAVWKLTDAIAASDTRGAVDALRHQLDLGRTEIELMGTINWLLKTAYAVARPGSAPVQPFVARKMEPLARKLGLGKLRAAFRLCMETEVQLRSTGVDRGLALELLVIKLALDPKRPSAA